MYTTIEAIYDNGKIIQLKDKIKLKHGKVLITIIEEEDISKAGKSTLRDLLQYRNIIKNLPKDPVKYQRELRDAW
jgi:predicted DNA-binding antitoxin AbrB/MazE fold protein